MPPRLHVKIVAKDELLRPPLAFHIHHCQTICSLVVVNEKEPSAVRRDCRGGSEPELWRQGDGRAWFQSFLLLPRFTFYALCDACCVLRHPEHAMQQIPQAVGHFEGVQLVEAHPAGRQCVR